MTIGQETTAAIDGINLLHAVLAIDVLVLAVAVWWRRRGGFAAGPAWWSPQPGPSGISDARYQQLLALILIAATALRSVSLGSGLWIDEILTLVQYVRLDLGGILTNFADDNQHMLYSALAHLSVGLFGETPVALRLPAMLFGVASIWAAAHLVRYVFGKNEALFTAALLTLSYHHVWFSQNARAYTMLLFGTLVATELLLRGLATGKWRYWLAYAFVIALSAWAHLTAVFVALAHALVLLFVGMRSARAVGAGAWYRQPLLAMGLAAWLTVNFYAPVIPQLYAYFNQPGAGSTTGSVPWSKPDWLIHEVLHNLGVDEPLGWLGIAAIAALGLYSLALTFRRDRLFLLLALAPALLSGLILFALGRSLWPRMFFQEIGFLAAIVVIGALGAGRLLSRLVRARPGLVQAAPAALLLVVSAVFLPRVYQYPKQDFAGARDYVKAHLQPGDAVVALGLAGRAYQLYYEPDWTEVNDLRTLREKEAANGYSWVVYTLPRYIKAALPEIQRRLDEEYEVVQKFPGTLGDGAVIVLRSKKKGTGE